MKLLKNFIIDYINKKEIILQLLKEIHMVELNLMNLEILKQDKYYLNQKLQEDQKL